MPVRPRRPSLARFARLTFAAAVVASLVPGTTLAGGPLDPIDSTPRSLTAGPGGVWFSADDGTTGRELYRTDGTEGGTVLIADINPSGSSNPAQLVAWQGWLYFTADDGSHGTELWRSNGTTTEMVLDIHRTKGSSPGELTPMGDRLYFVATNRLGRELWRTDGTSARTQVVKDIDPSGYAVPNGLRVLKGRLIFFARTDAGGMEPWRSDGTASGTVRIKDIKPGPGGSVSDFENGPRAPIVSGGRVFFWASDATHGRELWATNGTSAGTYLVKDIVPGTGGSEGRDLARLGTGVMFEARTAPYGAEPWISTGAKGNAKQVRDLNRGSVDGFFRWPASTGPVVYFLRYDDFGHYLYRTDGTKAGTTEVIELFNHASAQQLKNLAGRLWFIAYGTPEDGMELWTSNGTTGSTVALPTVAGHGEGVDPSTFSIARLGSGTVVYTGRDGTHGFELWRSGGTPESTFMVRNLAGGPDR